MPIPGFLTYGASKSFASTLGRGLSFELEGLGVDVLTYEPGLIQSSIKEEQEDQDPADTFDSRLFKNTYLSKLPLFETVHNSSRIALSELEISPYGSSCGTAIKHEVSEYLIKKYMQPFGMFDYFMYKYGVKARQEHLEYIQKENENQN